MESELIRPPKKTTLLGLLGGLVPAIEPARSSTATPLRLTSCPLKSWEEDDHMYPMAASLAEAHLAGPAARSSGGSPANSRRQ
ncbi:hypothetical protein VZT92_001223 [Zoarces viviparus]